MIAVYAVWAIVVACATEVPEAPPADDLPSLDSAQIADLPLDSVLEIAKAMHKAGDPRAAFGILRPTLTRSRDEGNVPAEARTLTWIGLAAMRLGDYGLARRSGDDALELKVAHGLEDQYHVSYNGLGILAYYENRFADADSLLRAAMEWGRRAEKRGEAATSRMNLALVQTELGQFDLAREGILAQRDTQVAMGEDGEPRLLGHALTNLGMLEVRVGRPAEAVKALRQAQAAYANRDNEAYPLGHLATAYADLGEHDRAFAALDTALQIVRRLGNRFEEASNLEVLAEHYRRAGDYERALSAYEDAKKINEELNETVAIGADLRGEAVIRMKQGVPARALEAAEAALELHREAGAALDQLYDHLVLAELLHELKDEPRAIGHLSTARRLAERLEVRSARVEVALTQARLAAKRSDHAEVLSILDRGRADFERGGYIEEWQSLFLRSVALAGAGMLDSAAVVGYRALSVVERVRGTYGSGALRTAFASDKRDVYGRLIETLVDLGRVDEAFAVADAARGRVLEEGVANAAGSEIAGEVAGEVVLLQIDRVAESIDLIETGWNATGDPDLDGAALAELYTRIEELRDEFEASSLADAESRGPREAFARVDPGRVRAALKPDEALIEYFVPLEGDLRIFVLTRSSLHTFESDLSSERLKSRVRLARELTKNAENPARSDDVLAGLYDSLIRPVIADGLLDDVRRLILVPHDILTYLPFPALRRVETRRFLIQDFEISRLPTAAALTQLAATRSRTASRASVFAPLTDELPATRREADVVRDALPGTRRLLGRRATEAELRTALREPGPVHVATHGIMNSDNPMFSRIVLAPGAGDDSRDDGRLEVHELLGFEARASLLFLSGCETGVGRAGSTRFAPGEDYATLALAFLRAGVHNVVATLWRVDDEGSATFAKQFYESYGSESPARALAIAQREMIRDETYSAPYYWAGYQLLGDGAGQASSQ